ncbi:hypothetical protein EDD15DRAFT_1295715 [Pisolithus albus]|nr:hypothetical protein EDD15DRAFT_1295715 [Pisolithus albus]
MSQLGSNQSSLVYRITTALDRERSTGVDPRTNDALKRVTVVPRKLCSWKSRDLFSRRAFLILAKVARSCTRKCEAGEKQNHQANFDKCHGRSTPDTGVITAHGEEAPLLYTTRCTFFQLAPGDVRNVQMWSKCLWLGLHTCHHGHDMMS